MTNILVLCRSKAAVQEELDALFEYSRIFSIKFNICDTNEDAMESFTQNKPKLFIALSDEDQDAGFSDLKFLQQLSGSVPLIVLSKLIDENTAVTAYQNGAIDFIRLPCGSHEFYYHIDALMRLLKLTDEKNNSDTLKIANLRLSLKSNQVTLNNEYVLLTNTEYKILTVLVQNLNAIVTSEELYHILWNTSCLANTSRTLSMHISNLRHKLGLSKFTALNIITVHKKGYCLQLKEGSTDNDHITCNIEADYK